MEEKRQTKGKDPEDPERSNSKWGKRNMGDSWQGPLQRTAPAWLSRENVTTKRVSMNIYDVCGSMWFWHHPSFYVQEKNARHTERKKHHYNGAESQLFIPEPSTPSYRWEIWKLDHFLEVQLEFLHGLLSFDGGCYLVYRGYNMSQPSVSAYPKMFLPRGSHFWMWSMGRAAVWYTLGILRFRVRNTCFP